MVGLSSAMVQSCGSKTTVTGSRCRCMSTTTGDSGALLSSSESFSVMTDSMVFPLWVVVSVSGLAVVG
ncbi:hypothetical protein ACFFX0_32765 [Citricoccus parietis]|uniref:Uncharacterized protein n=1 Tax=Citricoccus parietis TaxID=592307 RepID=A0ABV5G9S5_9MICC